MPQQSSPALPLAFGALVLLSVLLATHTPAEPTASDVADAPAQATHPSLPKPVQVERPGEAARGRHDDARCRPEQARADRSAERCTAGPGKRATAEAGGPFGALARAMRAIDE